MDHSSQKKVELKDKRKLRVRKKLRGTAQKPRMCVVKTNRHIHIQLIDDEKGITIASTSTLSEASRNSGASRKTVETGKLLGTLIAKIAMEKEVTTVVFDRGPHRYHGILAAVADSAREAGLQF